MMLETDFLREIGDEIPKMIMAFAKPLDDQTESQQKWKFDNPFNFLYGETIGWIEGYITAVFLLEYGRSPSDDEKNQISSIIQLHSKQIRQNFENLK